MDKRSSYFFGRRKKRDLNIMSIEEERERERDINTIVVPEIPMEPMKYLARSWSSSASGLSKVLISGNRKRNFVVERLPEMVASETVMLAAAAAVSGDDYWNARQKRTCTSWNSSSHHHHSIGNWFHYKDHCRKGNERTKERMRAEQAQVHAAVSVAGVAAAVAAVTSCTTLANSTETDSMRMSSALALATELLASHCIEMAELSGAQREHVISAVESAVDVRTPGDLMTLTAAAATALRGAATLKQRLHRAEGRSNAAVIPYEKTTCCSPDIWCKEGELLKRTRKGILHKKKVSVYINKKSQVIVKLKSKLMGGAISKKRKGVVFGVYEELPPWPGQGEREKGKGRCSFGLRTAQGLIELQCENGNSKRKWVDGINNLLKQAELSDNSFEHSFESLKLG